MSPSTTDGRASAAASPPAGASLAREMAATLALVAAVDAVAVAAFAYLVAPWVEPVLPPGAPSVVAGAAAVVAATGAFLLVHLRYARRGVLAAVGAEPVSASTHPALHARVTRLAAQFDLRAPEIAVVDAETPNSLAVGGPRASTLVVSRGLREALSDDELDAVVAHELAHVKNRDATVMTLATALPAVATGEYALEPPSLDGARAVVAVVGLCGLYAAATPRLPGPALSAASLAGFALVVVFTLLLGSVLLGLLAAPAVVLSRRLSRRRELVADAAGARATGDPAAMASAIRRLTGENRTDRDLRSAASLRGLCFLPHGFAAAGAGEGDAEGREETRTETETATGATAVAARTHPSVAERLENLRAVTASLER